MFNSFSRYNSFKNPVAASDVVYAASALLELCQQDNGSNNNHRPADNLGTDSVLESQMISFNKAYDCLGIRNEDLLKSGLN